MILSELIYEFKQYILRADPDSSFNYAPPSHSANHTVWNIRGTVKGRGDNMAAETSLLIEVRRWGTRYVDADGHGGEADPIVDALYQAFDTPFVTSSYWCDRDDKSEAIYHTWNVDYTAGALYAN